MFVFSFFTFSTFASNKLESSPPANSGLFNLTSSPFEIQFSGQIQSKHSLGVFFIFWSKMFWCLSSKVWECFHYHQKRAILYQICKKSNFLLEFEFCLIQTVFMRSQTLVFIIVMNNYFFKYFLQSAFGPKIQLFVHPNRRLFSFTIPKCIRWHEIYFSKCTCNETKHMMTGNRILQMHLRWHH